VYIYLFYLFIYLFSEYELAILHWHHLNRQVTALSDSWRNICSL
jgi:hypothetical protein